MELKDEFETTCKLVEENSIKKIYSDEELLAFYKYYKQATIGDCKVRKPSFINFRAKHKWNAWKDLTGLSKEDSMKKYINLYKNKN